MVIRLVVRILNDRDKDSYKLNHDHRRNHDYRPGAVTVAQRTKSGMVRDGFSRQIGFHRYWCKMPFSSGNLVSVPNLIQ